MNILLMIPYLVGSVVAYGTEFAYFQRKYPNVAEENYYSDMKNCLMWSTLSWIWVVEVYIETKFRYGFKLY